MSNSTSKNHVRALQQDAHVRAYNKWVFETDQLYMKRLRGEAGPPINLDQSAVKSVLQALKGYN